MLAEPGNTIIFYHCAAVKTMDSSEQSLYRENNTKKTPYLKQYLYSVCNKTSHMYIRAVIGSKWRLGHVYVKNRQDSSCGISGP